MPRVLQQQWDIPRAVTETLNSSSPPARVLDFPSALLNNSWGPASPWVKSARMIPQEEYPQTPGHLLFPPQLLLAMLTHPRYLESYKSFVPGDVSLLPARI